MNEPCNTFFNNLKQTYFRNFSRIQKRALDTLYVTLYIYQDSKLLAILSFCTFYSFLACSVQTAYTANPVPVMKTGIPCAHILTEKTYFNHRENLLSIQGSYSFCREPVIKTRSFLHAPCSAKQTIVSKSLLS